MNDEFKSGSPLRGDDLKLIKGIGQGIERRLHNANILTYAQLSARSPEEIAEMLSNPQLWTAEWIAKEEWIGQASNLAAMAERTEVEDENSTGSNGQHYASFKLELMLNQDRSVRRASVIAIQTQERKIWAGWKPAELLDFFVQQAALNLQGSSVVMLQEEEVPDELVVQKSEMRDEEPATTSTTAESAEERESVELDVKSLTLEGATIEPWEMPQATPEKLRAQVTFHLSGGGANLIARSESPYRVQLFASELMTGNTTLLASERNRLQSEKLTYTSSAEFRMQRNGRYQIIGTVLILEVNMSAIGIGPVLQVISD